LLDINVLVALFDPDHVHHEIAHDWFADNRGRGWATCPQTENGFLRVVSNPTYGGPITRTADLVALLRRFCSAPEHTFWQDAVSFRDEGLFNPNALTGHRQLADVYLLGLAAHHGGCLATFDRSIPTGAVVGDAASALEVIAPDGTEGGYHRHLERKYR
jgi:hypothetical protein